jgi:hypothetical protein
LQKKVHGWCGAGFSLRWAFARLPALLFAATSLLLAQNGSSDLSFTKSLSATNTQRLDLPSGGTLRLNKSIGELTVEGWDQPGLEITTIKWIKIKGDKPPKTDPKQLDKIRVTAERKDNDVVVTTEFPKHFTLVRPFTGLSDFELEYRIKAPRNANLAIDHDIGEVHIEGVTGDIHATDGMGQITVALVPGSQYAIDARSKLGAVDSDPGGQEKKRLKFGHTFMSQAPAGGKQLFLRTGFGDITILEMPNPAQK